MRLLALFSIPCLGALVLACGDKGGGTATSIVPKSVASCAGGRDVFSVTPLPLGDIRGWVPLGNLNPPAHTFPTDHQYIYLTSFVNGGSAQPLVAPGKLTIVQAKRTHYSAGLATDDYAVSFSPCADLLGEFGHVTSIEATLLTRMGPFDQRCQSYSPNPGLDVTSCYSRELDIPLEAGALMGTARGLDLSLFDRRVAPTAFANAGRWMSEGNPDFDRRHAVAFTDYYAEPTRSAVRALLGRFDGVVRRTIEPIGGTLATDVAGTAQGIWILPSQPTFPETPHLAIVPDNVDPTRITFSTGGMLPGLVSGAYLFTPVGGGDVNRDPKTITPSPAVYCWEIGYAPTDRRGSVLVQLVDANTLRVEARPTQSTCAGAAFAFTGTGTTYTR